MGKDIVMIKSEIKSPVDNRSEVEIVERFDTQSIIKLYDDIGLDVRTYFKNLSEIYLCKCSKTGYRFYYPKQIIGDDIFYEKLSKDKANYYSFRWEHRQALRLITEKDKVLEIGCGFGIFQEELIKKGVISEGIELNPLAIKTCLNKGLKVHDILINDFAIKSKKKYDTVCSFQVLEHIYDIKTYFDSTLSLLKTGGKLIIGVPNNNPYLFIYDKFHTLNLPPHHIGLWNKKAFKNMEKLYNIKLESISYEPISVTYDSFIKVLFRHMDGQNLLLKYFFKVGYYYFPSHLNYFIKKTVKGRNILVSFRKL